MTLIIILTAMMLCVVLNNMIESPMCGDCGKHFQHARDCPGKRKDRP